MPSSAWQFKTLPLLCLLLLYAFKLLELHNGRCDQQCGAFGTAIEVGIICCYAQLKYYLLYQNVP